MKAIMISIKPKWCALMMNGDKDIEVRKNKALESAIRKLIDKYGYADIYVYCSKDDKNILFFQSTNYGDDGEAYYDIASLKELSIDKEEILNGKVIFKFRCYKVEKIICFNTFRYTSCSLWNDELISHSCLTWKEMHDYFKSENGYYMGISNLEIFDKPKELDEFKKPTKHCNKDCSNCDFAGFNNKTQKWEFECSLTKAPQNFCYIEV